MKYIVWAIPLLLAVSAGAQNKQSFTLSASVPGLADHYVYLSYATGPMTYQTDSVLAKDGKFIFKGSLQQPVKGRLYLDKISAMYGKGDLCFLFLEPAAMQLISTTGKLKDGVLHGSKTQEEQYSLDAMNAAVQAKVAPLRAAYDSLNEQYGAGRKAQQSDEALAALKGQLTELKDRMEPYYDEMNKNSKTFVDTHPDSYLTADLLRWQIAMMPLAEGEATYAKLSPRIRASADGLEIKKEIDQLKMGSPGAEAYVFRKTGIDGQQIDLAAYKGKYVLLDFWASWCVPCRKGNPHLKTLYTAYKDKGLEIIGVADDDRNHDAWKKAVDQDGIGIWKHVLRGFDMEKREKNLPNPDDVSDHYGIQTLPTKVLIGPDGRIIGRYGADGADDAAMDEKLKALFGV